MSEPRDRSVGLGELAARTQAGGPSGASQPRQRPACRNPECHHGLTPGILPVGRGNKGLPIVGPGSQPLQQRWGWVNCLACNPPEGALKAGATYKHVNRSDAEIAQRAELATRKAPYVPPKEPARQTLGLRPGVAAPTPVDNGKLTELLGQNKKLSEQLTELTKSNTSMTDTLSRMAMQVAALLEDNAKLRKEMEVRSVAGNTSAS